MAQAILQFGTGRFLQAYVDLFVSQALEAGQAIGGITVLQTTGNPQSSARLLALARAEPYPVLLRGLRHGYRIDETVHVDSVREALHADRDWADVLEAVATQVQVIVSNTADAGYALSDADTADLFRQPAQTPRSFPAKLLVLLHHRWRQQPDAPLTLYPCELVSRNGDTLRDLVVALGREWGATPEFTNYLGGHCVWVNSMVDRIVSSALDPVGAVAEPYALWAIEQQTGMVLPCTHPAIVLTDSLATFERRKLWLLNLAHTFLAECWIAQGSLPGQTVLQAMDAPSMRTPLEAVWLEEVLPVFDAEGEADAARTYLDEVRERLLNPFLEHRLSDIAQNHAQKKQRRMAPVVACVEERSLTIKQVRLRAALAGKYDDQPP
ncbi:MAG: mannitol dehydrogenase family protein [Ideonella sp.]